MKTIDQLYGPFSEEEVSFYKRILTEDGNVNIMDSFQSELIRNYFCKYFGEPNALKSINNDDYIKLMIATKRTLLANNMKIFPYIISGKIRNIQNRKSINKKELIVIESTPEWNCVCMKYGPSIREHILSLLATIRSSEIKIIDYDNKSINGTTLNIPFDFVAIELLRFIILI